MSLPRFSIRAMLFGVLLVAGNCAALRLRGSYPSLGLGLGIYSAMPMSNILAIAFYRAFTRRTPRRPFLVGFGLSGALAVLLCFNLLLMDDERQLSAFLNWHIDNVVKDIYLFTTLSKITCTILCQLVILFIFICSSVLLQTLVALSGGWIARHAAAPAGRRSP
jgi:hypothetical protein